MKSGDGHGPTRCVKTVITTGRVDQYDIIMHIIVMLLLKCLIIFVFRECEWLFSSSEGRAQLAATANCERLLVVHLCRNHTFSSLKECQDELSAFVMELAPTDLPSNAQVPFLSVGNDNVGERIERCRGRSDLSGEYVVEDVEVNGEYFRRLIFLSNPNLTQSEAKLRISK